MFHRLLPWPVACGLLLLLAAGRPGFAGVEKEGNYLVRSAEDVSVSLPLGYRPQRARFLRFRADGLELHLFGAAFAQGEAGYAELISTNGGSIQNIRCHIAGRSVPFGTRSFGHAGLFALGTGDRPGWQSVRLSARVGGRTVRLNERIRLEKTAFRTFESSMDLGRYSQSGYVARRPDLQAFIRENGRRKGRAFSRRTQLAFDGRFFHPRDRHFITSPFHAKRVARRYALRGKKTIEYKPFVNIHSGTDLKGGVGESIFAVAAGQVALAEKMYYEGNFTILDHGQGVFTTYMHQSRLDVSAGQRVQAGALIGAVGATGMVTGPHLHISLYIRGVRLEPLSLLVLPIRR